MREVDVVWESDVVLESNVVVESVVMLESNFVFEANIQNRTWLSNYLIFQYLNLIKIAI